jgi:hypothetical protein
MPHLSRWNQQLQQQASFGRPVLSQLLGQRGDWAGHHLLLLVMTYPLQQQKLQLLLEAAASVEVSTCRHCTVNPQWSAA